MDKTAVITVAGPFDVARSGELQVALREAFATHRSVGLGLATVTDIDLAGLQLICSAHRTAVAAGIGFSLSAPLAPALATRASEVGFPRSACVGEPGCPCLWSDTPEEEHHD